MYTLVTSKQYLRAYRKFLSSKANTKSTRRRLARALELLLTGTSLPRHYGDHALRGEFAGYRECHIKNDLLLVYQYENDTLVLVLINMGSHSELFG